MATYVPAKRATEYIFWVGLESVASAGTFQTNPTLATGDATVIKDGGASANLTTLPAVTPAGGKFVKVTLSSTEMTADNVTVLFSDASGGEWKSLMVNIQTAANQIDDLATAANLTTVDTVVDAIKVVTDALPEGGALTTIDANIDSILADTGTDGVALSTTVKQAIADTVLGRSGSNVDSTASTHSLYELIQAILESSTATGDWVIKKTDGTTTFNTRTLATDASAVPIIGVS